MSEISTSPATGFMSFNDLIRDYTPAHTDSWDEWWDHESHFFGEGKRVIDSLIAEYETNGKFDEPVILCAADSSTDEETGEVTHFPADIGNGMHRLKAHHSMGGNNNVFVQFGYTDSEEQYNEPTLQVTFCWVDETTEDYPADFWDSLSWRHWDGDSSAWLKVEFASSSSSESKVVLMGGSPDYISAKSVENYLQGKFVGKISDIHAEWVVNDFANNEETVVPDYTEVFIVDSQH